MKIFLCTFRHFVTRISRKTRPKKTGNPRVTKIFVYVGQEGATTPCTECKTDILRLILSSYFQCVTYLHQSDTGRESASQIHDNFPHERSLSNVYFVLLLCWICEFQHMYCTFFVPLLDQDIAIYDSTLIINCIILSLLLLLFKRNSLTQNNFFCKRDSYRF